MHNAREKYHQIKLSIQDLLRAFLTKKPRSRLVSNRIIKKLTKVN